MGMVLLDLRMGAFLQGDMLNGERHGHGKHIYANGVIFVGEWKEGKKNGRGVFTDTDGKVYEYDFKDGEPIDP